MSDTNRVQLAYIEESTFGAAVTGSNLQTLRLTSESLKQESGITTSQEIRSDRQIADLKRLNVNAAGDINFELSFETYDDFILAAIQAASWASEVPDIAAESTISATASGNTYDGSDGDFSGYTAGQWIKVTGFTTAGNNGFCRIVTINSSNPGTADDDSITVEGLTLTNEAAGDPITIYGLPYAVNGTTQVSYNIERVFSDLTNILSLHTGMTVGSMSLEAAIGSIVTGSFGFLGSEEESLSSSNGTGYDAATTTGVMNGVDDVVKVIENGSSLSLTNFSMQLTNNLRSREILGTLGAISIGAGSLNVTGNIQAYFETHTLMDKFINQTASGLAIVFEDSAGNAYIVDMPRVKYSEGSRNSTGLDGDVMADLGYQAYRHETYGYTIQIAKLDATP